MYHESTRNFDSNKLLGAVGALLIAIGSLVLFSGAVGIVGIVGLILVLISMKGLADDFREYSIYRNALSGVILGFIGVVISIIVFASFSFLSGFIFQHPIAGAFGIVLAIVAWLLMFLFMLISGIFYKNAFSILAFKSNEGLLRTGGTLILVGSILTIIYIGFFLLFIGWILITAALFSLRPPMQPAQPYTPPPPPPSGSDPSGTVKYCPYCGAENKMGGTFCTHCGRRLNPT
jgi:uncharacterized membrane protein